MIGLGSDNKENSCWWAIVFWQKITKTTVLFKPSEAITAAISYLLVDNLRCLARGACQQQKYSFEFTNNNRVYLFVDDDVFLRNKQQQWPWEWVSLMTSVVDEEVCRASCALVRNWGNQGVVSAFAYKRINFSDTSSTYIIFCSYTFWE